MAGELTLVLGGARSGKSAFAESLVRALDQPTVYLATGQPTDAEMSDRIQRHRRSRPAHWITVEEPLDLGGGLRVALGPGEGKGAKYVEGKVPGAVLIDSLDIWVANLVLKHQKESSTQQLSLALSAVDQLLGICASSPAAFFVVSSEVGLSLVPPSPLGRRFQDLLGEVNQKVASRASRAYLVIAGMPLQLK